MSQFVDTHISALQRAEPSAIALESLGKLGKSNMARWRQRAAAKAASRR